MARKFLTNLNIVGATLTFREGEIIRHCIENMMEFCDHIVVVLDNQNQETEKIVLGYKKKHNDLFTIGYSGVERLDKALTEPGRLKSRLNRKQGRIRNSVLREVLKVHKKKKIDLLIWPDADECFTEYLPDLLERFWAKNKKQLLFLKPATVFDSFKIIKKRTLAPHGRIFKYRPDMSTEPYRFRSFHQPFKREEIMTERYVMVHLAFLNEKIRRFRKHYARRQVNPEQELWQLDKDVRKMSKAEITKRRSEPHSFTVGEYLVKHNLEI